MHGAVQQHADAPHPLLTQLHTCCGAAGTDATVTCTCKHGRETRCCAHDHTPSCAPARAPGSAAASGCDLKRQRRPQSHCRWAGEQVIGCAERLSCLASELTCNQLGAVEQMMMLTSSPLPYPLLASSGTSMCCSCTSPWRETKGSRPAPSTCMLAWFHRWRWHFVGGVIERRADQAGGKGTQQKVACAACGSGFPAHLWAPSHLLPAAAAECQAEQIP